MAKVLQMPEGLTPRGGDGPPPTRIAEHLAQLGEQAAGMLEKGAAAGIHQETLARGGKLLRPRIVLLIVAHAEERGARPDWACARRAALAIELAHVGTLYHDDLVDRSTTRRGVPAVHVRLGGRAASLGGAHLLTLANALAAGLPGSLPRHWGRAALHVADGQVRETERAGDPRASMADYHRVARRKTASLFELAARFGAEIGYLTASDAWAMLRFGTQYGLAFQLADDLDDFVTEAEFHRRAANDLRERLYTARAAGVRSG